MLIAAGGIADHIRRLSGSGWLKEALLLAASALENRLITATEHRDLIAQIRYAEPTVFSRPQEVFGMAHDSVISSLQFTRLESRDDMREAFRQAVRWVEIETSSQCNRRCSYCPNSIFDRTKGNDFLDPDLYAGLLSDLTEIDFDGEIVFVGNNEFLMHDRNFAYLADARRRLGGATLAIYSNGDYLDAAKLEQLAESGVDRLAVTLHPAPGKPFDEAEVERRATVLMRRTGLKLIRTIHEPGEFILFATESDGMDISVALHNFAVTGHNWAGLLPGHESHVRTDPCSYPLRQFVVNHDGDIFSCCFAFKERNDSTENNGMWTGNLRDYPSIFHAYASEALVAWRRAAFTTAPKDGPCRTCTGHLGNIEASFAPLADHIAATRDRGDAS